MILPILNDRRGKRNILLEEGIVGGAVERNEGTANVERGCCGGGVDYDLGNGIAPLLWWGGRRGGSCLGRESLWGSVVV